MKGQQILLYSFVGLRHHHSHTTHSASHTHSVPSPPPPHLFDSSSPLHPRPSLCPLIITSDQPTSRTLAIGAVLPFFEADAIVLYEMDEQAQQMEVLCSTGKPSLINELPDVLSVQSEVFCAMSRESQSNFFPTRPHGLVAVSWNCEAILSNPIEARCGIVVGSYLSENDQPHHRSPARQRRPRCCVLLLMQEKKTKRRRSPWDSVRKRFVCTWAPLLIEHVVESKGSSTNQIGSMENAVAMSEQAMLDHASKLICDATGAKGCCISYKVSAWITRCIRLKGRQCCGVVGSFTKTNKSSGANTVLFHCTRQNSQRTYLIMKCCYLKQMDDYTNMMRMLADVLNGRL